MSSNFEKIYDNSLKPNLRLSQLALYNVLLTLDEKFTFLGLKFATYLPKVLGTKSANCNPV